jgi:hypothetical protein
MGMIRMKVAQPAQMIASDRGAGLGLDGDGHVAKDEIHFDAACKPPVTE